MNLKNIFILISLAMVPLSALHSMEEKNPRDEKNKNEEEVVVRQPLGLKAACLELYSKQNVPDNILPESLLPRTLSFITSSSEPRLRLEILKKLRPEVIEAGAEGLASFVIDQIVNNLASEQTGVEQELIKRLPADQLEPIVDIIFNEELNVIIKILLINKLSAEFCQKHNDRLIALFQDQETPHDVKCALFENVPALLKIKYARDLMEHGVVTETLIEKVGDLCAVDPCLVDLVITNRIFSSQNEQLFIDYFIKKHRNHLATNALLPDLVYEFNVLKSLLDESSKLQENLYRVQMDENRKIEAYKKDQAEPLFSFTSVTSAPDWGLSKVPSE